MNTNLKKITTPMEKKEETFVGIDIAKDDTKDTINGGKLVVCKEILSVR